MKVTLILLALISVSCGKIDTPSSIGVGEVRELRPIQISVGESLIYDSICAGLTRKAQKFSSSLPSSLVFDVNEKDCNGTTVNSGAQQVRVDQAGAGFQLSRQDTGAAFVFPNVETSDNGLMAEVCAGAQSMPMVKPSGDAVWVSLGGFSSRDCPGASGEQCVMVETGVKQGTTNVYRIHTREIVRFNINATNGKYGYFTHRKKLADSNCDDGKSTDSTATLR